MPRSPKLRDIIDGESIPTNAAIICGGKCCLVLGSQYEAEVFQNASDYYEERNGKALVAMLTDKGYNATDISTSSWGIPASSATQALRYCRGDMRLLATLLDRPIAVLPRDPNGMYMCERNYLGVFLPFAKNRVPPHLRSRLVKNLAP